MLNLNRKLYETGRVSPNQAPNGIRKNDEDDKHRERLLKAVSHSSN